MNNIIKLIINADDFGFSPSVNSAILSGAIAGNITAASLMVNMPFAEEAAKSVQNYCNNNYNALSLGLHFTITSGKPVSKPSEIPLLIDSQGLFRFSFFGLLRMLRSKKREQFLRQIQIEFFAQMELMNNFVTKYRLRFDHLDSHQHIHVITGIFDLLKKESDKRNLSLRIPREIFGGFKRIIKRFHAWFPQGFIKRAILNHYLKSTKQNIGYFGILESGKIDEYSLQEILRVIETDNFHFDQYEINIHPSDFSVAQKDELLCCSAGDYNFHNSQNRTKELQTIQNKNFQTIINKHKIKLTGFTTDKLPY
ncbi:MAG: ChbG/HpnK family deacetylase [Planctomycetaceae bacterium]|nr:ChbG/HpnK family deacetylase [Planctomycetaceae bacterium]